MEGTEMPLVMRLLTVVFVLAGTMPVLAESSRTQRDVALQALQLSDGIALNTAKKGSIPAGLPPGVYPNRERDGRVVCTRQRVSGFNATDPSHVELVTVCAR
jgi:hypothetical protein